MRSVQHRLDSILSHLDVAILVEDARRHILFVNQPFCDLFGIPAPPEALVGMDCAAMADDSAAAFADPVAFLRTIDQALASGRPLGEQRLQLADGRWVELDYVPEYEADTYSGHAWLYRNVTRRAEEDARVRASEASLEALLNSARDPLWSVDHDLRLVHFNRAFRDLCHLRTGWSPVAGGPVLLAVPEGLHHRELGGYRSVLKGATHEFVLEIDGEQGQRSLLDVLLAPIRSDGRITGVVATGRDVTEVRRTSQLLRDARDAAEAANSAKSDFLAHISHELRTPLNAMIGMVDLTLETPLDARQRSYLLSAQANSVALLDLISDVLDFSSIEAGEMHLDRAPFDPREVVEDVVGFLATEALRKGLELRFSARDVPERILGDYHRYRQVAVNLVGNALKYTEHGHIDVSLVATPSPQGVDLTLRVTDSGIGIAKADQGRVFTRFARSQGASRTSGTGLGLSITARLTELMGGHITLQSELGQGSTFCATIPVQTLPATASVPIGGAVILASPDADQRARWAELAASLGLEVHGCADGAELVEAFLSLRDRASAVVVAAGLPGPPVDSLRSLTTGLAARPLPWLWVSADLQAAAPDPSIAVIHQPLLRTTLRRALQAPVDPDAAVDLRRGARVLVAEDHADSRRFMVDTLRRDGHDATAWADGVAAQGPLLERGHDLALLDLDMPGIDGLELTAQRRAHEQATGAPRLPIVLVSGHATEDHRRRAQDVGVDAFVPKPLTRQRLLDVVERILDLRPKVLLADDAADARRLWSIWLRQAGADVLEASDGQQAVELAQRHRPDAVLLDMEMPVLDGYGVATQLRRAGHDVPILGITGHTGSVARRKVLDAGCTSYLAKPVRRAALVDELRSLLWAGTQTACPPGATDLSASEDDLGELVHLYLEERAADVVQLREAVHVHAWETVRALGHRMKGTAVSYGYPEVESLGRALEEAAAGADPRAAMDAVDRLDRLLHAARTRMATA